MTQWIAYVPTGQEFALVEDCEALGVEAFAPRKVEAVRTGNKRWPEKRVMPYLPNYVFVTASPEEYYWMRDIKYVRDIMGVPPAWVPKIADFCNAIEREFAARSAEIDRAQAIMRDAEASKAQRREAILMMQHYQPDDLLEVIVGPFAGTIMAFGRMVERAGSMTPEIEANMTLFGRVSAVRLDPLHIKKVG